MLSDRNWRLTYRSWKKLRQPVGFGLMKTLADTGGNSTVADFVKRHRR